MRFLVLILSFFILFTSQTVYSNNKTDSQNLKPNPYDNGGVPYISISLGAGSWCKSLQSGMENQKFPYAFNIAYGKTERAFGLILGVNIHSTYVLDDFLLNPNYFSLALRYQPLKKIKPFKSIRFYTYIGGNVSYSRFTEQQYSSIVNYENKLEKQFGFGMHLGASITYKIKNFEIGPEFVYNSGKADFLAGYFTKQSFNTGSLQLNIHLRYNIIFDRNKNACPAYRNFQRINL
jgi:hypothetical protein